MKKLLSSFILAICFNNIAFAAVPVSCDAYFAGKVNYLFNVGIVGGNNNDPNSKRSVELFPDKEVKENNNWIQYYYLNKYQNYKKILLVCVYNNGQSVVKVLPKTANICIKKYTSAKINNNTSSIISFNCQ